VLVRLVPTVLSFRARVLVLVLAIGGRYAVSTSDKGMPGT
jgi:hypothetical protein